MGILYNTKTSNVLTCQGYLSRTQRIAPARCVQHRTQGCRQGHERYKTPNRDTSADPTKAFRNCCVSGPVGIRVRAQRLFCSDVSHDALSCALHHSMLLATLSAHPTKWLATGFLRQVHFEVLGTGPHPRSGTWIEILLLAVVFCSP